MPAMEDEVLIACTRLGVGIGVLASVCCVLMVLGELPSCSGSRRARLVATTVSDITSYAAALPSNLKASAFHLTEPRRLSLTN